MSDANKYKIDEVQAAQLKEKVEALRAGITEKAHHLVHIVMPQRVLALSELYNVCAQTLTGTFHSSHHICITDTHYKILVIGKVTIFWFFLKIILLTICKHDSHHYIKVTCFNLP
jgi:hypothetical protein